MFSTDRLSLRKQFLEAWTRHQAKQPLTPLQTQIVALIQTHPEYHAQLNPESLDRDYQPEQGQSNPFLHLSMHLSIQEQVSTNRPTGIRAIHRKLSRKLQDQHAAEHQMMECLGFCLWEAQRQQRQPDQAHYLEQLKQLL